MMTPESWEKDIEKGRSGFKSCLSHLLATWPWEKHCNHSGSCYPASDGTSSAI